MSRAPRWLWPLESPRATRTFIARLWRAWDALARAVTQLATSTEVARRRRARDRAPAPRVTSRRVPPCPRSALRNSDPELLIVGSTAEVGRGLVPRLRTRGTASSLQPGGRDPVASFVSTVRPQWRRGTSPRPTPRTIALRSAAQAPLSNPLVRGRAGSSLDSGEPGTFWLAPRRSVRPRPQSRRKTADAPRVTSRRVPRCPRSTGAWR